MEGEGRGMRLVLAAVLTSVAVAGGIVDLVLDAPKSWRSGHVLYELGLILGGLAGAIWLWLNWKSGLPNRRGRYNARWSSGRPSGTLGGSRRRSLYRVSAGR